MAKRKPVPKKIKSTNGCFIITVLLLILLVISLGATFYFLFLRPGPTLTTDTKPAAIPAPAENSPPTTPPATQSGPAVADEPPPPAPPAEEPAEPPPDASPEPPAPSQAGPRLAILIDDIGNTRRPAEQIIALDLPLAFSILPHTPHANHLASLAKARGRDLLLHLPMEANDPKWSPSPGALLLSMSNDEMVSVINQDLDSPYRTIGVNNHMGSKFSEDQVAMRVFLRAIKSRGLFFIDSLTSINSVGYALARDLGIKTAKRDIFLDNEQDMTKILAQIGRAINLARKNGSAIAIGHPYPATLEALRAAQTRLSQDITLVPIHELVE